MLASLHLLHKLGAHHFGPASHAAICLRATIKTLYQIVCSAGDRIVERAVKGRRANQCLQFVRRGATAMHDRHGLKTSSFEHFQAGIEMEELLRVLVVNVELKKVVRQLAVMNRVLRVKPFAVKNEPAAEHRFQRRSLYRSPLLELVILWM